MRQLIWVLRVCLLSVLSLAASAGAYAQFAPGRHVAVELKGYKIVRLADGKEGRESAEQAKPGDMIEYTATFTNRSKSAVTNVAATLPIPSETEYIAGSAQPAGAQAALTDGVYQAIPLKRKVKLASGAFEVRDVPLAAYRTLRWLVGELAPGKAFAATARVRVSAAPAAPTKK